MSAPAVAHPRIVRPRAAHLHPVPDRPAEPPVTVTITIGPGPSAGRDRVLAALRELVEVAGARLAAAAVTVVEH
jgi:hypothetical protein